MAVFRRYPDKPTLYMKFTFEGEQIYRSCKTTDRAVALKREKAEIANLAKLSAMRKGLTKRAAAPFFRDFACLPTETAPRGGEWWDKHALGEYSAKPETLRFYIDRTKILLNFRPFADVRLDEISNKDLSVFKSTRKEQGVSVSTINRDLATLRVILKTAELWEMVDKIPKFQIKVSEEPERGVAVTFVDEAAYMAAVDQDHRDLALVLVETAMMPSEAAALRWSDVHFGEVRKWKNGYVYDRCEKTMYRPRELGMTPRLALRLKERRLASGGGEYVFPSDKLGIGHPTPLSSFQTTHQRLWHGDEPILGIKKFRLYDFRHTALTRAWEAGADIFDLMAMGGWNSIAMAQKYVRNNDRMRSKNVERMADYAAEERRKEGLA